MLFRSNPEIPHIVLSGRTREVIHSLGLYKQAHGVFPVGAGRELRGNLEIHPLTAAEYQNRLLRT